MINSTAVVLAIVATLVCIMFLWVMTREVILFEPQEPDISYVSDDYNEVSESILTEDQRQQAASRVQEHNMPKCNEMLTGKTLVNACHEVSRKETCANFFQKRSDGYYYCDREYNNGVSHCAKGNLVRCK